MNQQRERERSNVNTDGMEHTEYCDFPLEFKWLDYKWKNRKHINRHFGGGAIFRAPARR